MLLLAALASTLYAFGIIRFLPTESNLFQWDVYWYDQIRRGGYEYSATTLSNVAFFPLFPYFWRATGLNLLGISLLNGALLLGAFTWLAHVLRLPARLQLLLLSTPSLLFAVVPYSEALFFCFATLLLIGLHRRRLWWWVIGLIGCGFTRSASTTFIPALAFTVLLWASQPGQRQQALRWGVVGLLAVLGTIAGVAAIQWWQTGEPWGFILAQKHWGHILRLPNAPLGDPAGIRLLWLDALALWVGMAAIGICCWLAWRWQIRNRKALPLIAPEVLFSLGYCVSIVILILFYQGGGIWNIGRYTFVPPFFLVLVGYLAQKRAWPWRRYVLIGIVTMLFWQLFGIYTLQFDNFNTSQALWYFALTTAYLLAYLAWRQLRWQGEITMVLYVFNLMMLLHLLDGWLQAYAVQ